MLGATQLAADSTLADLYKAVAGRSGGKLACVPAIPVPRHSRRGSRPLARPSGRTAGLSPRRVDARAKKAKAKAAAKKAKEAREMEAAKATAALEARRNEARN